MNRLCSTFLCSVLLTEHLVCNANALVQGNISPAPVRSDSQWTILSPKPGQKAQGEEFRILVGSTSRKDSFRLFVDKKQDDIGSIIDLKLEIDPGYAPLYTAQFEIYFSTNGLLNGPHTFEVRGPGGTRKSLKLDVDNFITTEHFDDVFCPTAINDKEAGTFPTACEVRARLKAVARWTVSFVDYDGRIIRKFEGKSNSIKVIWDGYSIKKTLAQKGSYECVLTAYAKNGVRRQTLHFTTNLIDQ